MFFFCFFFTLDAPSPPAAPTTSQVLSTTALVQWRAPFDGNSPIISYRLQYRKLGDQDWSVFSDSIGQTITVVEDLEPSSSYRFRVSATNEIGASDMGEQTDLVKTLAEGIFFFEHIFFSFILNSIIFPKRIKVCKLRNCNKSQLNSRELKIVFLTL